MKILVRKQHGHWVVLVPGRFPMLGIATFQQAIELADAVTHSREYKK